MERLDPARTALVVVDLQQGMLALPLAPHSAAEVVARSVRLGKALAAAGGVIVLVNTDYAADYADRPNPFADRPMSLPEAGLPQGWATLDVEVSALDAAIRITKRQQSAFFGTELDLQLRRRGVDRIVLCGVATNFGVEATARDGNNFNYGVVVASDACSSLDQDLHAFALANILPRIARVREVSEIIAVLSPAPRP